MNICSQPLLDLKVTWSANPVDYLSMGVSAEKALSEVVDSVPSTLLPSEKAKLAKLPRWMDFGLEWARTRLDIRRKAKDGESLEENFVFEHNRVGEVVKVKVYRLDKNAYDWIRDSFYSP